MVNFYCKIGDGVYIQPFLFTSSHKGGGGFLIFVLPILLAATTGKYLVGDLLFRDTCPSSYYSHIYILFKMLDEKALEEFIDMYP